MLTSTHQKLFATVRSNVYVQARTCRRLAGHVPDELTRTFGLFAGQHSVARLYPEFYAASGGTLTFLLEVESRINELVRTTVPHTTSERRLCALAEGLIEGVADYYGEILVIEQSPCMLRGDLACALFVVAQPAG